MAEVHETQQPDDESLCLDRHNMARLSNNIIGLPGHV
jgi:hypothetical protein